MTRNVTRIAIAVPTRRRPRMLADLMQSLQALAVPQGAELCFVFVENDTALSIGSVVDAFHKRSGWPAVAVLEPDIGVSHARNTALEAARAQGAQWIAFVDDDQQVRHDWLRILWAQAKEAGADLAGGPVIPVTPSSGCSDDEAEVLHFCEQAAAAGDARKMAAMQAGRRFDLHANNWIADIAALDAAGLRFEGASDDSTADGTHDGGDLSRRAHAAGLTLVWVPAAVVTEEVPSERLRSGYLLARERAECLTQFQLDKARGPIKAQVGAVAHIISNGVFGSVAIAVSPVLGRYWYYRGICALGRAQGFWAGLRGYTLSRYSSVTGE